MFPLLVGFFSLGGIGIAIAAFAATDIDDLLVLILFFSDPTFPARHVVMGQFLGIGLLLAISLAGVFLALVVPPTIIALLGIAPISIGIKNCLSCGGERRMTTYLNKHYYMKKRKNLCLFFLVLQLSPFPMEEIISVFMCLYLQRTIRLSQ